MDGLLPKKGTEGQALFPVYIPVPHLLGAIHLPLLSVGMYFQLDVPAHLVYRTM